MSDLPSVSAAQMHRLAPLFSRSRSLRRVDDRRVLSGIIYVIRHGPQWKDAPRGRGPHETLCNRFIRWSRLGVPASPALVVRVSPSTVVAMSSSMSGPSSGRCRRCRPASPRPARPPCRRGSPPRHRARPRQRRQQLLLRRVRGVGRVFAERRRGGEFLDRGQPEADPLALEEDRPEQPLPQPQPPGIAIAPAMAVDDELAPRQRDALDRCRPPGKASGTRLQIAAHCASVRSVG